MKSEETVRNYSIPDPEVPKTSRVIRTSFLKDQTEFQNFDSDYGGTFGDDWLNGITASETCGSDDEVVGVQTAKTEEVHTTLDRCHLKVQVTKRFFEKAFPGNADVLKEIGYPKYDSIRNDQAKMEKFMNNLYKVATKYSVNLIAAKFTQHQIEEIHTLALLLSETDTQQEDLKRERKGETVNRIDINNACWSFTSKVLRDGKLIFANNPVKKKLYTLYMSEYTSDSAPETPAQPTENKS